MSKTLAALAILSGSVLLAGCESDEEMAPRRRAEMSPIERNSAEGEIRGGGQIGSGVGAPIIVGEFGNTKGEPMKVRTPLGDFEEKPKAQPAPASGTTQPAQNALPVSPPRGFSDGTK